MTSRAPGSDRSASQPVDLPGAPSHHGTNAPITPKPGAASHAHASTRSCLPRHRSLQKSHTQLRSPPPSAPVFKSMLSTGFDGDYQAWRNIDGGTEEVPGGTAGAVDPDDVGRPAGPGVASQRVPADRCCLLYTSP